MGRPKGQVWGGKDMSGPGMPDDTLPRAVQQWLKWSRCCLCCGLRWARGSMCYIGVYIGATWKIRLNCPCSAALQKRLNQSRCPLLHTTLCLICPKLCKNVVGCRLWTRVGRRKHYCVWSAHLLNTTAPSMFGVDAACCQIALTTRCY